MGLLLAISLLCGVGSLFLAVWTNVLIAAVIVAMTTVSLLFFGIFLADVKVYDTSGRAEAPNRGPLFGLLFTKRRFVLQVLVDAIIFSAAFMSAFLLRYEGHINAFNAGLIKTSLPFLLVAKIIAFWLFSIYRSDWRFMSVRDVIQIFKANTLGTLLIVLVLVITFRFDGYSRAVIIMDWVLSFLFTAGCRALFRIYGEGIKGQGEEPVLIVGAGKGADLTLRELANRGGYRYKVVGLIDDDPKKRGENIHGVRVIGDRGNLEQLIKEHSIKWVIVSIAKPLPEEMLEEIRAICGRHGIAYSRIQPIIQITSDYDEKATRKHF